MSNGVARLSLTTLLPRGGWALALLVVLGGAIVLGGVRGPSGWTLATPDRARADELHQLVAGLPDDARVLVAMDADLGTYPEIRPATRAALGDLLARGAGLAFVSYSPEGRAIAVAERDRLLGGGTREDDLLDLGFVSGSEAGLVRSVTELVPAAAQGPVADAIRAEGGGMPAFAMGLVVTGTDLGARSWVEQVGTRLPELPLAAIAPGFARPELEPYLATGQLQALVATARDGAAYVELVDAGGGPTAAAAMAGDQPPSALAMLVGMLVGAALLVRTAASGLVGGARGAWATRRR